MNFSALLVLLVLMTTASSSSASHCNKSSHRYMHSFRHVSDLKDSSVAPWTLRIDSQENRLPQKIQTAECKECKVANMTAKPIFFTVLVYICDKNNTWSNHLYELAVGCTCVSEQQQRHSRTE